MPVHSSQCFDSPVFADSLTFVDVYVENVNDVNGLDGANSVAVSPDGKHVYTTGETSDAIAVFSRDSDTGELEFVEQVRNNVDATGLDGPNFVTVSPDGKHVYVMAAGDSAITVFSRNSSSGRLSFVEDLFDNLGGVDGLGGAGSVTVSPDGKHVYPTAAGDSAIAVFSRNSSTGRLTFIEAQFDNLGGVDGLGGASSVTVSPKGKHVYATGLDDSAMTVFLRTARSRGLYVDGFKCILSNNRNSLSAEETALLLYAQTNDIQYLALHDLYQIWGDADLEAQLDFFIRQAKLNFGILEIGAIGDNENFFDDVIAFNENTSYSGEFDVLNLEFEYWIDAGKTFAEFLALLDYMNAESDLIVETYIGSFEAGKESSQARDLADRVERLLLSAYVTDPSFAFDNTKGRLRLLGEGSLSHGIALEVWPIFSAENTALGADETFMGPWLDVNSLPDAETEFISDYNADNSNWKNGINIGGFQYFSYRYLSKLDLDDDGIADYKEDTNKNSIVDPGETDPCDIDTDGDGIQDGTEMGYTLSDVTPDTDLNIFQPDLDPSTTTDPLDADSDNDGLLDGEEDANQNGRVDPGETDPNDNPNPSNGSGLPGLMLLLL